MKGMLHLWGEVHAGFWWGNLKKSDHLQNLKVDGWSLIEREWIVDKRSEVVWSEVGWRVVKCSEGLSNRVSTIIRREVWCLYGFIFYHILSHSFVSIFYHCTFCMLLFDFVNCVFLLLFIYCSVCSVSLCCFVCKCVLYYCHRVSTQLR